MRSWMGLPCCLSCLRHKCDLAVFAVRHQTTWWLWACVKHTMCHNLCAESVESRLRCDTSKLICPKSASASVFIHIILSRSSLLFSARAFHNRFVVCAVILPTFVSVACNLDNLRSLPLVCRLRCPQISGFTFAVISRS